MLPGILLSGFLFPVESMPAALQFLSQAIPARWYLSALKSVMLKGTGIETIWKEALILAGMCIFILYLGIKNFKIRLS
jgi:ABC-2 type transport system permease protein